MSHPIYVVGGTVQAGGGIYVPRSADEELLSVCQAGGLAYVLSSRQIGKSSLMIRAAERLIEADARVAILDLTELGANLTAEQWYRGILLSIAEQLNLKLDIDSWWQENTSLGITDRFTRFFRRELLSAIPECPIAIFIDEIDTTRSLPFRGIATDDFFASLRALYLARAHQLDLKRLSIVLLGTAAPSDLIADHQRTPFNLGQRIQLKDFSEEEAAELLIGSAIAKSNSEAVLRHVLAWTGGQPYLTLRVFRSFQENPLSEWSSSEVEYRIRNLFFGSAGEEDSNLQFVRDMLIVRPHNPGQVLRLYLEITRGNRIHDSENDPAITTLKLSGVVKPNGGFLEIRNRIYREIFAPSWALQHLPEMGDDETKGWREAMRRIQEAQSSTASLLDLSGLKLVSVPDTLAQLHQLRELYLQNNQLTAIPDSIGELQHLEFLVLDANKVTAIPQFMERLSHLQALYLNDNQIAAISASIGKLSHLRELYLNHNQLDVLPAAFGQLKNLRGLYLSNNRLTRVPKCLSQLVHLEHLDLANNKLIGLPRFLSTLPKLKDLFLHGNEELGIPDEILGPMREEVVEKKKEAKQPREILSYLSNITTAVRLNEAKLILLGQGGVGKTSLVRSLTGQSFRKGQITTEGIKISNWEYSLNREERVRVHVWDFGGQEMMHATHQFFLTARSLYLLVLNRRTGGVDREADYWFRMIRSFGGKNAPVIVVLHKQKNEPFDVNRGGWLEKYRNNIKGFIKTDCEYRRSINQLRLRIREELQTMDGMKAVFPRRWFAIKNELSHLHSTYITYDKYREICRKHGEDDPAAQASLANFLHDLGIALNYKDDPRLRFAYVLKPEWITKAIYALLHAFAKSKGLFIRSQAELVLKPKGYSPEAVDFILGLMEQFELSFPLDDTQERSLIPQLLDDQQPKEALEFNVINCLNFGYKYEIVPEGLLPRFIVRTHHLSEIAGRWKSGVILHDPESRARALVRADLSMGMVSIHVDGPEETRRELLSVIRYNFRVIHSDYEFKPVELVYPPNLPEKPFVLEELQALSRSGTSTIPVLHRDGRVVRQNIQRLIEPVKTGQEPLKLFLSYAHRDEKYASELRQHLKPMERNGLIRTWDDRAIVAGEKWDERMSQELRDADIIVCQLSRNFLASDFLVSSELEFAIQRQLAGEAVLVAYLLSDCAWQEVPRLLEFQILPRDAKPLSHWEDKQRYWVSIAEGIRGTIEHLRKTRASRVTKEFGSVATRESN